jgi:hypothetical protein
VRYVATVDENLFTALMQEFNSLRAEILARSNAQHTLLNLNVTILGTLIGFAIAGREGGAPLLLLLVPLVSNSIGFLYLDHHTAIQRAGVYIDERIRPVLQELASSKKAMSWETFFNEHFWRRRTSKVVFWAPLSILFIAAPIGATVYTFPLLSFNVTLTAVWVFGVLTEIGLFTTSIMMFSRRWVRGYRN